MLTPSKYWRVPCELDATEPEPAKEFILPQSLVQQASPPTKGHGVAVAAYDDAEKTGMLRWLGIITGGTGATRIIEWKPTTAQIWVDTPSGRGFWKAGAFGFAKAKIADYGLHELWQEQFDGMELRDHVPAERRPTRLWSTRSRIAPERLNPIEVVGEPTKGPRAGVVYILKSAYGYKVGRIRNVPARMRAFGVQLPIIYSIPLCAWFDDCHQAERRYHHLFANKRINGEWFDLNEADIQQIRLRAC
ncbi:GIY-YIG nuclease family protein [Pollutimonas bauzanensis]|uniref:T5orf172 domain-containing protein n=1 Tax=Pollutimonas bauzanensis TaxID=658167 RepID=A0A1M5UJH5_9BURK|nr:GIY-YIG nuclease family protein [Pollutimonas bauzanensis]SHH62986.1 T5orf172 domain-containing protein [Pollutimonas bauzanensis]